MEPPSLIVWRERDLRFLPLLMVLVTILAALIVVLYISFTVLRVDGDSMAPTLQHDDRVLMTRRYGIPVPGDVVSFAAAGRGSLIKRVVAVPYDTVEVIGDVIYVNGELVDVAPDAYINPEASGRIKITVPRGTVYVLGDNRPIALDSRHIGPVPLQDIEGKVVRIILPLDRAGALD